MNRSFLKQIILAFTSACLGILIFPQKSMACVTTSLYTVEVGDSLEVLVYKMAYGCTTNTRVSRFMAYNDNPDNLPDAPYRIIFCDPDSERMGAGRLVLVVYGKVQAIKETDGDDCYWDS